MCQYWNSIHDAFLAAKKVWEANIEIPWLMMFDVDLQITFFKLLEERNKINS